MQVGHSLFAVASVTCASWRPALSPWAAAPHVRRGICNSLSFMTFLSHHTTHAQSQMIATNTSDTMQPCPQLSDTNTSDTIHCPFFGQAARCSGLRQMVRRRCNDRKNRKGQRQGRWECMRAGCRAKGVAAEQFSRHVVVVELAGLPALVFAPYYPRWI
jgi:hypothetical protein